MSVTPLFNSNPSFPCILGLGLFTLLSAASLRAQGVPPAAVGSQANTDASAQRRLQENAREAQRQRRIEQQIRALTPALQPDSLAGPQSPVLTRRALAALFRLKEDGVPLDDALSRATRSAGVTSNTAAKPAAYLRNLFTQKSGQFTPAILTKLEAGEDPGPDLVLSPFIP